MTIFSKYSNPTRREALSLLGLAAAASVTTPSWALAPAQDQTTVRFGYRLLEDMMLLVEGKLPQKYGVNIEERLFTGSIDSREGFVSGQVDLVVLGTAPVAVLANRFRDFYIGAVSSTGGGKYSIMVPLKSDVKTIADLKGKKIAVSVGSAQHSALTGYAQKNGMSDADFQLINAGDADAIAALQQGSVDAVAYWEPIGSIIEQRGLGKRMFNFAGLVCNPAFWCVSKSFADKHEDIVNRFFAGIVDCNDQLKTKTDEAAVLISNRMKKAGQNIDSKVFSNSIRLTTWDPIMSDGVLGSLSQEWKTQAKKNQIATPEPDWKSLVKLSFFEKGMEIFEAEAGRKPEFSQADNACK